MQPCILMILKSLHPYTLFRAALLVSLKIPDICGDLRRTCPVPVPSFNDFVRK